MSETSETHLVTHLYSPDESPSHTSMNTSQEDWITLDFPNTISVDVIPVENSGKSSSFSAQETLVTPLELSENSDQDQQLIEKIAQLEAQLEESENRLQEQNILLEQKNLELYATRAEITRFFSRLEFCHQIIQQQEVTTEELTRQLEITQTRYAQLERECALTQQRYHEQHHQLLQAENMSREFRARLHRQQRHTLQFKAALEKCLERKSQLHQNPYYSPCVSVSNPLEETCFESSFLDLNPLEKQEEQIWIDPSLHNSPVQPWKDPEQVETPSEKIAETVQLSLTETSLESSSDLNPFPHSDLEEIRTYWHIESDRMMSSTSEAKTIEVSPISGPKDKDLELFPSSSPENSIFTPDLSSSLNVSSPQDNLPEISKESSVKDDSPSSQNWLNNLTYSPSKKRRTLAEIQLPSFT